MQVNIGFLKAGLVRGVEAPDDFLQWPLEQQAAWADERLRELSEKALVTALSETPLELNDIEIRPGAVIFDETPLAAVIEQGEEAETNYGDSILLTEEWQAYYRDRKLITTVQDK